LSCHRCKKETNVNWGNGRVTICKNCYPAWREEGGKAYFNAETGNQPQIPEYILDLQNQAAESMKLSPLEWLLLTPAAFIAVHLATTTTKPAFSIMGVYLMLIFALVIVSGMIRANREKASQNNLDGIANNAVEFVKLRMVNGAALPLTLYLRPFEFCQDLVIFNPRQTGTLNPAWWTQKEEVNYEHLLSEELVSTFPLIGIGEDEAYFSGGRVQLEDETWQEFVSALCVACYQIIILPSTTPGSLWEVRHLMRSDFLDKCFFLMPPESRDKSISVEDFWGRLQAQEKDIGLELPEFIDGGLIFQVDKNGKITRRTPLYLSDKKMIGTAIDKLKGQQR
jgi:hypothetical protein